MLTWQACSASRPPPLTGDYPAIDHDVGEHTDGGIRTRTDQALDLVPLPIGLRRFGVPAAGVEPATFRF